MASAAHLPLGETTDAQDDQRPSAGQLLGRDEANSRVGSGHDGNLAAQVSLQQFGGQRRVLGIERPP